MRAAPSRSLPCSRGGMEACCTCVKCVWPIASMARAMLGESSRDANVASDNMPGAMTLPGAAAGGKSGAAAVFDALAGAPETMRAAGLSPCSSSSLLPSAAALLTVRSRSR